MDTIAAFMVALGFDVNQGSLNTAKKSISDYEKAVRDAEKRVEDARWEGAKSAEEISKLTREANLKEARAALAAAEQREKAEKDAAQKRKKHNDEFMAGMSRLALAATAMATAVSYAANRVAQSFDHLGFVSARTGASVQSINSLSYAFRQTGGSAQQAVGAVESFAKAIRENSGVKSYVQSLGVDMTKDTAQQLLNTVEALNKQPYDVGFRQAGLAGISEEDYNLISRQLGKIKEYRAEYNATTKALGIDSGKAAEASMAFQRTLTRLQATVSALSDKLLISLAPAMEKILKGFNDWIAANPGKVDEILTGISNAAIWLAEKLGGLLKLFTGSDGDEFMKKWQAFGERMQKFADNVDRIASGIEKIARFLSWSSSTSTSLGTPGRTAEMLNQMRAEREATPPDDRKWYEKVLPKGMGGKDAPAAGDGSRSFRNNNPGNIKMGALARSMGATEADDKGFARFPDYASGRKAQEKLLFESKGYKDLTIRQAIARWAPAGDGNDPAAYADQMAKAAGVGVDSPLASLSPDQRSKLLDAQQKKEGWIPGYHKSASDDPAPAGASVITNGIGVVRSKSGRTFKVAAEFAANFQGFLDDYEKAGGVIGPNSGGINTRGNRSYHPNGRAIDINQVGRGVRAGGKSLPLDVEDALAAKWGLRSGNSFSSNDNGHFEVHRAEAARAAVERLKAQTQSDKAAASALTTPTPGLPGMKPRMDPGGFDVNAIMKPNPAAALNVVNNGGASTRAVHQTFNQTTTINGSENPRQAARIMESAFGNMHSLALQNAQSATV
ncbi:hypothetical protein FV242_27115 [Methylobacterium sp. WL64]|uniref:hypothetical protein n=1 Tax=Methylobacterium sp. WL64 TaxID=2603894 RepID=UPI0011C99F76|nr:hypothetical protein [Methylobacterium sp. WL64]TXM98963.1 hypothetical protein FV242_27115 [Methylobacterium sp. WL64]